MANTSGSGSDGQSFAHGRKHKHFLKDLYFYTSLFFYLTNAIFFFFFAFADSSVTDLAFLTAVFSMNVDVFFVL